MKNILKKRRNNLIKKLQQEHPGIEKGALLLFAGFEQNLHHFKQENSLYYLTGISEPGVIMISYFDGRDVVYIANTGSERSKWVNVSLTISDEDNGASAEKKGFSKISYLGEKIRGYALGSLFHEKEYAHVIKDLKSLVDSDYTLFTLIDEQSSLYEMQQNRLLNFCDEISDLSECIEDCSYHVHEMRKTKDDYEIACIERAVAITAKGQKASASALKPDLYEYQIRAELEYAFLYNGAVRPSFPSIVATGKNTTVLHYTELNQKLKNGDLVVVDIGAEYVNYAADITRTYPVSGLFTARQKEVYEVVLATQEYAFRLAKPGMFLINPHEKEKSLHHRAVEFLKEKGFEKYFVHALGHYLGLDVHDVGDYRVPLQSGDAFTIEPGVYIPEENLGVRIEDNYVITQDGCRCLSDVIPKQVNEIESLLKR